MPSGSKKKDKRKRKIDDEDESVWAVVAEKKAAAIIESGELKESEHNVELALRAVKRNKRAQFIAKRTHELVQADKLKKLNQLAKSDRADSESSSQSLSDQGIPGPLSQRSDSDISSDVSLVSNNDLLLIEVVVLLMPLIFKRLIIECTCLRRLLFMHFLPTQRSKPMTRPSPWKRRSLKRKYQNLKSLQRM
jgi:hypothetical protein